MATDTGIADFTSTTGTQNNEAGDVAGLREGRTARAIESVTAKLPLDTFLYAALASIAGSLTLQMMGRRADALFVGQWAPTFLILGVYNKLVKVAGHDRG